MKQLSLPLLIVAAVGSNASLHAIVVEVNGPQEFKRKILESSKPAVVKFSSKFCGPCQQAKKPFEELSNEPDLQSILFASVALDPERPENIALGKEYKVDGVPTFTYIIGGQRKGEDGGFANKAHLNSMIRAGIAKHFAQEKKNETNEQPAVAFEQPEPLTVQELQPVDNGSGTGALRSVWNWIGDTATSIVNTVKGWFGK